jgi:hypothetical protein
MEVVKHRPDHDVIADSETPPESEIPLTSLEEVIAMQEQQTSFDLRRTSDTIRMVHYLSQRHIKWVQPGAAKPRFNRLLTKAIRQLEADSRIAWSNDRAERIVLARR